MLTRSKGWSHRLNVSLRVARFDFVQEEHVSGSKSKEGLEAGISQPLQGGSQDSGTSTPRHDVPPSTQQEPASRESSRSDASAVSASDMQAAPTPLQVEAVDAFDKALETLDSQQLNEDLLRLTGQGANACNYLDLPAVGDLQDKEVVSHSTHVTSPDLSSANLVLARPQRHQVVLDPTASPLDMHAMPDGPPLASTPSNYSWQGSVVWMQGEKFQGEVQQNCVAIADSVVGQIVFIFKFQDLTAMPQEQADVIVKLIMDVDHHLPVVVRGKNASTLNGYMKCTLDRHSCCGGDFGRSKADREDPVVGRQVLRIMQEEIKALRLTFPVAMMDIYSSVPPSTGLGQWFDDMWYPFSHMSFLYQNYAAAAHTDRKDVGMGFITWYLAGSGMGDVFQLPEMRLSFTLCHGSMMAFCASKVVHGTRIPDAIGQGCQRIGSAIALQRRAINVAVAHHKEMKVRVAQEQDIAIATVKKRHAQGVNKHGQPLKRLRSAG
ncbi:TPA: hypothetical protein ACH3X1_014268 [Trebouxia sp. C0004]